MTPAGGGGLESLLRLLLEEAASCGGVALQLGAAAPSLVDALGECGVAFRQVDGCWPTVQLTERYGVVIAQPSDEQAAAIVHCAVQHVTPGGVVVFDDAQARGPEFAERFDLERVIDLVLDHTTLRVHRRTSRFTIHDLVFEARSTIRRVDAAGLAAALQGPRAPLVVDTRTHTDRERFGVIAGSVHAPRTVLEWHLDPANGYRHPAIESLDAPVVIVCNGGYSSSLAVANLLRLGFTDVADLVGGMQAWIAAGLPTSEPDHSHLDL